MERLTMKPGICANASTDMCLQYPDCYACPHGKKVFQTLHAYEDTDLPPDKLGEMVNQAYDLGYQSCLNHKGMNWTEAEELQRYRETGLTIDDLRFNLDIDYVRIVELLKAAAKGRLMVLPCKPGDLVWGIRKYGTRGHKKKLKPVQRPVEEMYFTADGRLCIVLRGVCRGEWGKVIFGTEEEAMAAMQKEDKE